MQLDYIYQIFAIIACLLGLYYCAGFSFGKGKPYRTCLFSLLGLPARKLHPMSTPPPSIRKADRTELAA